MRVTTEAGDTIRYEYGPYGNRIRRLGPGGAVEGYVYDRGNLIAETDATGAPKFVVSYFPADDARFVTRSRLCIA